MSIQKKLPIVFAAIVCLVLLVSACSQVGGSTGTQSSLSVGQVIQKSADTMKQLKSSHVDLQSTISTQATGATPGTSGSATATPVIAGNVNLTIKGSGDQQLPDQEQMNLTINNTVHVAEILQGDKVYVKNAQGQWYVLDKNALQSMVGDPFSSANIDQSSLLGMLQSIKITDNGTQDLNGQSLRHITAQLDKNALRQLLSNNPQLKSSLGAGNIDTALNNTKSFLSSADVWIDETNFYVHRSELKISFDADTSSIGNGAPSAVKTNFDTIVDLSNFNAPVTITPPTNATPTDNPATVLGITG